MTSPLSGAPARRSRTLLGTLAAAVAALALLPATPIAASAAPSSTGSSGHTTKFRIDSTHRPQHVRAARVATRPELHSSGASATPSATSGSRFQPRVAATGTPVVSSITYGASGAPTTVQSFTGADHTVQVTTYGGPGCTQNGHPACDPSEDATPPDTQVAVGPDSIVQVDNSAMWIFGRNGVLRTPAFPCDSNPGDAAFNPVGCANIDLLSLFQPTGLAFTSSNSGFAESDARIWYSPADGRFFISALVFSVDANTGAIQGSAVLVLATDGTDPSGPFTGVLVDQSPSIDGVLRDQPQMAITDDKVALTWNSINANTSSYLGSQIAVLTKADVINTDLSAPVHEYIYAADATRFGLMPVSSVTGGIGDVYLLYNNSNPPDCAHPQCTGDPAPRHPVSLGFLRIGGQPGLNNPGTLGVQADVNFAASGGFAPTVVAANGTTPAVTQANAPTGPPAHTVDSNDDRLLQAVRSGNTIWATADDTCPAASTLACGRLFEVNVANAVSPTLSTNVDVADNNARSVFFPVVMPDAAGHVVAGFNVSGAGGTSPIAPAFWAADITGTPGARTLTSVTHLKDAPAGGYYDCSTATLGQCGSTPASSCGLSGLNTCPPSRFGDYSGVALDPLHGSDVWFAGEYAAGTPGNNNVNDWGVALGRFTSSAPSLGSLTPRAGPVYGGTSVTVGGNDLALQSSMGVGAGAGATPSTYTTPTVQFGGTGATVQSATPDGVATTAPAHSAISTATPVTVTDTTALGADTPATTGADTYTYNPEGVYRAVTPFRICDTRGGTPSFPPDSRANPCNGQTIGQGGTLNVSVSPVSGAGQSVPSGAVAVVLNVTAVNSSAGSGFITVYPAGTPRPLASNLNLRPGALANLVTVTPGSGGQVSVFNNQGSVDVIVDVQGYYQSDITTNAPLGRFNPITPARFADTRSGSTGCVDSTCQRQGQGFGTGTQETVAIAGRGSVPATATAVVLNLTAVNPSSSSWLAVWPADAGRPLVSNVNFPAGRTLPNRVVVPLSTQALSDGTPAGSIFIYNNSGHVDVLVDVDGWFNGAGAPAGPTDAVFNPSAPVRIADTRPNSGQPLQNNTLGTNGVVAVPVANAPGSGIPPMADAHHPVAVVANITVVSQSSSNFVTVWPSDQTQPNASDLNLQPGEADPNLAYVGVAQTGGKSGDISIYNAGGTVDAIVDTAGWFSAP